MPRQRGCLDLLQRGCSSHRPQGNLGFSTSLYTPCIVRFCCIDPTISVCFLMSAACTMERGLSSESNSVSDPPTPSSVDCSPLAFQSAVLIKTVTDTDFRQGMRLLQVPHRGRWKVLFPSLSLMVTDWIGLTGVVVHPPGASRRQVNQLSPL